MVTGPLSERMGLLLAGGIARSTRVERDEEVSMDSRAATLTAHLTYKATPRDDVRLFAQSDGLSFPAVGRAASRQSRARADEPVRAAVDHVGSHGARRPHLVRAT